MSLMWVTLIADVIFGFVSLGLKRVLKFCRYDWGKFLRRVLM